MEGLAALVREAMGADPFCVFRAKRVDRVKLIFWRTVVIHLLCDHAR
jgi:transposase